MFCEKCGKQINDNAMFCSFCGYTVGKQPDNTDDSVIQMSETNAQSSHINTEIDKREFLELVENSKLKKDINTDCILIYIIAGLWTMLGYTRSLYYLVPVSIAIIVVTIVMIQKKYNYIGGIVVLVLSIISISPFGIGVGISFIRNLIKLDNSYRGHISS